MEKKIERLNRIVSAWKADILGAKNINCAKKLFFRAKIAVNKYCNENCVPEYFLMKAGEDLRSAYTSYCKKEYEKENNLVRLMIAMYNYHDDYEVFIEEMKKYGIVFDFCDSEYGVASYMATIGRHRWYFEVSGSNKWRSPLLDENGEEIK